MPTWCVEKCLQGCIGAWTRVTGHDKAMGTRWKVSARVNLTNMTQDGRGNQLQSFLDGRTTALCGEVRTHKRPYARGYQAYGIRWLSSFVENISSRLRLYQPGAWQTFSEGVEGWRLAWQVNRKPGRSWLYKERGGGLSHMEGYGGAAGLRAIRLCRALLGGSSSFRQFASLQEEALGNGGRSPK